MIHIKTLFARQVNWQVRKWTLLGNPPVEARMTAITFQAKEPGCYVLFGHELSLRHTEGPTLSPSQRIK